MVGQGTRITVACVLWQGAFRGRGYTPTWVSRLKAMAQRQLPPHRFVCLSNVELEPGVERIPLVGALPGWWSKLELFRPDIDLAGQVLYFDLDVLLVARCDSLLAMEHEEQAVFMPPSFTFAPGGKPKGGPRIVDRYQSSVFTFRAGRMSHLYTAFVPETHREQFRGDQDWIGHASPSHRTYPAEWFCKLRHCLNGPLPETKVVLSMPWKNEEAAERFEWVKRIWIPN